ncbi:MAG: hypothetical protein Q9190_005585 [Brigantiaea leucoxantha]
MDYLKKVTGGDENKEQSSEQSSGGGGFMDKVNSMAGGGKESEKKEDYLDKGIDYVQENVMGQGPQNNESAVEQAKDEQISDFIRSKYKSTTGSDMPIADK